jgi:TolA-binding protein
MKKLLAALAVLSMHVAGAWALQDPSLTTTQSSTRLGSRSSSAPSINSIDTGRMINLSGKIVMADGAPIPQSVQVDLSCQGQISRQTYASKDGNFHFELGAVRQAGVGIMDASVGDSGGGSIGGLAMGQGLGNMSGRRLGQGLAGGRMDLTGCEILVRSIPGYQADGAELGPVGEFEGNIGDIYMHPLAGVQGVTVSSKTLLAPRSAAKEFEKARKELDRKSGNTAKASIELQRALQIYPDFPEAWNLMGDLSLLENNSSRAREAFLKAIELDPKYITPYLSLTHMEISLNQWSEATRLSDRIIELNPYLPLGRYFHALAHFQARDFAGAEKSIQVLQSANKGPRLPLVHYMMGVILARRGDYINAAREFTSFLELPLSASVAPMADKAKKQIADWQGRGLIPKPQTASLPGK